MLFFIIHAVLQRRAESHLNTSHVILYLPCGVFWGPSETNLNTSHVILYHSESLPVWQFLRI